ncbi:FlgO family outer membrane protein [Desulfosarcina ovata]|uniref:FlgO domain-containing protein n=2 Tax=Desulfosarcina ovata TaxID=83564 RepID=A0A5K8AIX9_9BACT|nr:FlgO family outer membrane protein [Desulfosarcina ovata]BBO85607.1 hypothetical protein DSCO28_61730 [Desulfosarcina ovata subsp. sediminis]BBO92643.1 hypothetical protein DSCOOX_58230 [Desulfosarcina ovata subsp. ovata]
MKKTRIKFLSIIFGMSLFSAVFAVNPLLASSGSSYYRPAPDKHFISDVYRAADTLENNILYSLNRTKPIIITSFVDFNNLQEASSFGRLVSDLFATRLAQHGFKLIELKLRKENIVVNDTGEFALSRDLLQLSNAQSAQAVIVGTYAINGSTAIINVKMLNADNGAMIATHAFNLSVRHDSLAITQVKQTINQSNIEESQTQKGSSGVLENVWVPLDLRQSTDAKLVQHRLSELKLYDGKIDGIWGPESKRALSKFIIINDLGQKIKWNAKIQRAVFEGTGR